MTNPNPQLGPATALVQLLTEHPELPEMFWTFNPGGWWSGSLHEATIDARAVMAQFVAVVGGEPHEMTRPAKEDESGTERFSTVLHVTWRDVHLYLSMSCDAASLAEVAQVAA